MIRFRRIFLPAVIAALSLPVFGASLDLGMKPFVLPAGADGIGFDDLTYAPDIGRILVPGGRTGKLFLIDPKSGKIDSVDGFSEDGDYTGGHGQSTTSADFGGGYIFAIDRTARFLVAIDPVSRKPMASARLTSGPDYVRYVSLTGEVWVTEPEVERIETFRFESSPAPRLTLEGRISVKGGPESLAIDNRRRRAYTHLWKASTVELDLTSHAIISQWKNGCQGSRGIALDESRDLLFAGCAEGGASAMNLARSGAVTGHISAGADVDIIAYNPVLGHLYVPGGKSQSLAIVRVMKSGGLRLLGTVKTAANAHCVASDNTGGIWVCDPDRGRLLFLADPFSPTP